METFAVDKCFYDIGSNDLRDLWDTDLDPTMQDVLRSGGDPNDMVVEWSLLDKDPLLPTVVLHDRLMTDAALGNLPIKTEHSYSLTSDGDSLTETTTITHAKIDIEDDFPTICVNPASVRLSPVTVAVKDEPLSDPDSPTSSCPNSPIPEHSIKDESHTEIDIEMDTDSMLDTMNDEMLKHTFDTHLTHNKILLGRQPSFSLSKVVKVEPSTGFVLPPTPPSCSSSEESEDNAPCSQPSSPSRNRTNTRVLLSSHTTTRQPIHTPLISSQPKGSTGTLVLTEEEKRTLIAEGYPVPTRLPLTKAEEKSLKKIRRKIKNKISAQESRRKKKEYMDQLERKVELLVSENSDYRKKIESLEDSNNNLMNQLAKLQAIVARTHPQILLTSRHTK